MRDEHVRGQHDLADDLLKVDLAPVVHVRQPFAVAAELDCGHVGADVVPVPAEDRHDARPLLQIVDLLHRHEVEP